MSSRRGPAPSNVDLAVEGIRDALVSGRLRPGERIKEVPLAEELGFSRAPVRDALRLLERDGLVQLVPNRGAIVPELRALDVLEVYALRASLGTLALQKLMLEASTPLAALDQELARLVDAGEREDAGVAADADLGYQQTLVAAAGLPRVANEFERLTWQVRTFLGALEIDLLDTLSRVVAEVQALHEAIAAGDLEAAERLWREKFERWIRDLVGKLGEDFDDELWIALTRGAGVPARRLRSAAPLPAPTA